ncbi:MAG: DNA-directed RNA polymerase II subunit RPB11 [archaeon]|nr:DNA-directed RNA polymerase II subunit RPB11 [archaeon]
MEYTAELNNPDSGIFTIYLEDHTLGNSVRMMLLRNPNVKFAGYRKPHPLENKIEIKIQTNGQISPIAALNEALRNLDEDSQTALEAFEVNIKNKRIYLILG